MAKSHKVLSPMPTFGGSHQSSNNGKADSIKVKSTPDPLGLVKAIGGKK